MGAYADVGRRGYQSAQICLEELIVRLRSEASSTLTHDEVERLIAEEGREVMRRLMQAHLEQRSAHEDVVEGVVGADGVERRHHRRSSRGLMTVFGPVTVARVAYGARGHGSLHPLDGELNLPEEVYSHGLRRLAAEEASRGSYDQTVDAIVRTTRTEVPKRQTEELVRRAACDFDGFYRARAPTAVSTDNLLVLSVDGKGIVMRREDLLPATRKLADESSHKLAKRLSRGEKRGRKRMATVAAVYDLVAQPRTALDVLQDLAPARSTSTPRPRAKNKRVWARLEPSLEAVVEEVFQEALRRDPLRQRHWVVLVDGNAHQLETLRRAARRHGVKIEIVLDFIHVLEYLWRAAWCFHQEGDPAVEDWVHQRALSILRGSSSAVAAGIRRSATKRGLRGAARRGADACVEYLVGHRKYLRYRRYLRTGLPIATGVIEGACRHLVRDRMEITGARWSVDGAEAILRLRSLRSSGDFEHYWAFHLQQEQQRNHSIRFAQAA